MMKRNKEVFKREMTVEKFFETYFIFPTTPEFEITPIPSLYHRHNLCQLSNNFFLSNRIIYYRSINKIILIIFY